MAAKLGVPVAEVLNTVICCIIYAAGVFNEIVPRNVTAVPLTLTVVAVI